MIDAAARREQVREGTAVAWLKVQREIKSDPKFAAVKKEYESMEAMLFKVFEAGYTFGLNMGAEIALDELVKQAKGTQQ